ncbi:leucine--tRNA ligase [Maudiozyma humilis]|uniref:leucine--tRNA ligase n=1 Tax=Maudiozyma humilis TaxID=51915 RepID=A0AAV5S0A9_MAUHU|nr:leucine--tRNA ligase [Kazachstania humilis]
MSGVPGNAAQAVRKIGKVSQGLIDISKKWKPTTLKGIQTPLSKINLVKNQPESMYILSMFPYPSGMLHMGHLRVYVISDALNRFYQQRGHKVIHPMGWDAFGLPAENAAIERGINPKDWTDENIAKMKEQMGNMLANFSWDREVKTCDPEYYKFTQMIFLKMLENGLAYRKEAEINWDPVDKTVLANEQVDASGHSWRSGALVEKKMLRQWFLKITDYVQPLLEDMKQLKHWPSKVRAMQRHWIGKSEGARVTFKTTDARFPSLSVYTTRVETISVVQFISLSGNHDIVTEYAKTNPELAQYVKDMKGLPDDSKSGFEIPGIKVINPWNQEELPVFVAPYVIDSYANEEGSVGAAVMGVPGHDKRDYEFASENMPNDPIRTCLKPSSDEIEAPFTVPFTAKLAVMDEGTGESVGTPAVEAREDITKILEERGVAKKSSQFKIRDWLISRQRYWGTPIPIIHCHSCGPVPVPESDLPVVLPEIHAIPSKGGNPLANIPEFVDVKCPKCGEDAKRETDTMDTFIDSSWYFFRYLDSKNKNLPFDYENATKNMPVNIYLGGVEHAILHLLYSRFISKFLGAIGMWDGAACKSEPFDRLITQGMVHGKTYVNPENGHFLKPDEIEISESGKTVVKGTAIEPTISYEKMSKSKYNGADPDSCIAAHGPDATRAHILFQAPVNDVLSWDETKIVGVERWLHKNLTLVRRISGFKQFEAGYKTPEGNELNEHEVAFHNDMQKNLRSITDSFERTMALNTVISDYMKITNNLEKASVHQNIRQEMIMQNLQKFTSVLYPVAPSISEEMASVIKENQPELASWNHYEWPEREHITEWSEKHYQVVINGRTKFKFVAEKDLFKKGMEHVYEYLLNHKEGRPYLVNRVYDKMILKYNIVSFVFKKPKKPKMAKKHNRSNDSN